MTRQWRGYLTAYHFYGAVSPLNIRRRGGRCSRTALSTPEEPLHESSRHEGAGGGYSLSGKYCYGKTPMQTFLEAKHLATEKMLRLLHVVQQAQADSSQAIG